MSAEQQAIRLEWQTVDGIDNAAAVLVEVPRCTVCGAAMMIEAAHQYARGAALLLTCSAQDRNNDYHAAPQLTLLVDLAAAKR